MLPFIGWLVSKGYVSPSFGRMLEVAALTAVAAGITYAADALSGGKTVDWHQLESAVLVAFMVYVSKAARDAASQVTTVSLPVSQPVTTPSDAVPPASAA